MCGQALLTFRALFLLVLPCCRGRSCPNRLPDEFASGSGAHSNLLLLLCVCFSTSIFLPLFVCHASNDRARCLYVSVRVRPHCGSESQFQLFSSLSLIVSNVSGTTRGSSNLTETPSVLVTAVVESSLFPKTFITLRSQGDERRPLVFSPTGQGESPRISPCRGKREGTLRRGLKGGIPGRPRVGNSFCVI